MRDGMGWHGMAFVVFGLNFKNICSKNCVVPACALNKENDFKKCEL